MRPVSVPAAGLGGAIMNDAGTFTVSHSEFRDNQAVGGRGGGVPAASVAAAPSATSPSRRRNPLVSDSTLPGDAGLPPV